MIMMGKSIRHIWVKKVLPLNIAAAGGIRICTGSDCYKETSNFCIVQQKGTGICQKFNFVEQSCRIMKYIKFTMPVIGPFWF